MRLIDLAKRGRSAKIEDQEEKLPPASKTDESRTRESEPEALSGVDEQTAQSLKSVEEQPSPEPMHTQSPPPLAPEAEEPFPPPELVDEQPFPPAEPVEDPPSPPPEPRSDQPAPSQEPVDDQSPPEPVERISLSRILSMNLDRSDSAASEEETPLDITLESGEGETPFKPAVREGETPLRRKRESSKIPLKSMTGEGALPLETQTPGGETPLSLASTFVSRAEQPAEMAEPDEPPVDETPYFLQKRTITDLPNAPSGASDSETGRALYDDLRGNLVRILQGISKKKRIRLDKLHPLVETMVSDAPALEELYRIALSTRVKRGDLSSHLIHVATFSVKLGQGLRLADAKLKRLNLAALLHDVGMCLVSRKLPDKKGALTAQETALIQRHPEFGFQVVKAHLGDDYLWLAEVIRQEHERDNGSGYPQQLSGNEIQDMAQIIAVADVYEALTHDRPHRPRLLPYRAVRDIIEHQKNLFSPSVLKALLQQLSVFPLNSLVRLNSNAIARVVGTHAGQPLRPDVHVVYDPKGDYIEGGRAISLRENPLLYIVDSVDESEVGR